MKNIFCLFFVLISVSVVSAMDTPKSTSNCHCFKDRVFDPQRKFAADKYLLTTSFNSFIAANFHISKSQIVMMKMKGAVDPDNLLIGLFVARAENVELNSLLAILANGGTWKQILTSESVQKTRSNDKVFNSILAALDTPGKAVEVVTDQLLKEFFGISDMDIAVLRKEGASGREITLVYLLERYGKREKAAPDILTMYTREHKSWGEIATFFGLSPKGTGKLLMDPVVP
jgi:hypothetical protein